MKKKEHTVQRKKRVFLGLAVTLFLCAATTGCRDKTTGHRIENLETEEMAATENNSGLRNAQECYLCGKNEKSQMDYFRRFDDLGVICMNNWYVLDMGIRGQDEEGEITAGTDGVQTGYVTFEETGYDFETERIPGRRISRVTIKCGQENKFQIEMVKNVLCQDCLDKIMNVVGENRYDVCLVDFQTMELYPLEEGQRSYLIRDYYVETEGQEGEIKILGVYAPQILFRPLDSENCS
ncbi:MAG: hypothetical protein ACI4EI_06150 [Muricoprocola sp.]